MRYFYEYKEKDGCRVAGHNLENIIIKDDKIVLQGVDIIPTHYDSDYQYWSTRLDMYNIEYLKIEPMQELENNESGPKYKLPFDKEVQEGLDSLNIRGDKNEKDN